MKQNLNGKPLIKINIHWLLIMLLAWGMAASVQAVQFYDISRPGIKKIKLHISTNDDSAKTKAFVGHITRQMNHSLFFALVDSDAEYALEMDQTVESGSMSAELKSLSDSGFEPLEFGISFKSGDDSYLKRKSAQVGNLMLKKFFGVKGSIGSSLVYSMNDASKTQSKTLYTSFFGDPEQIAVTKNLFSNYGASWDPSGNFILYTAVTSSGTTVYMQQFRPLRLRSTRVFSDKGKGSAASWGSNDLIYVAKYVKRQNTDIYEYRLDTKDPQNLSGEKIYAIPNPKLLQVRRITKSSTIETEPTLSPDGKQLALMSDRTGTPQIYRYDMKSKKLKRITQKGDYNVSPSWSPDGRYIAYSGRRDNVFSIFRIETKSMEENRVTPKSINAEGPTWSPDGSLIAFSGKKKGSGDWKIYYSLSSGGEYKRLTKSKSGFQETSPSWKP